MKRLLPIFLAAIIIGCDSASNFDGEVESLSGNWKTTTLSINTDAGNVDWAYLLQLDVSIDGSFSAILSQEIDGSPTPGTQTWHGMIDVPVIDVFAFSPARVAIGPGSVGGFRGTISEHSITLEGAPLQGYPNQELRFFRGK